MRSLFVTRQVLVSLIFLNVLKQTSQKPGRSCLNFYYYGSFKRQMSSIRNTDLTVHSALIEEIYEMPIDQIIRPLPSTLDECKVDSLMKTLKVSLNMFLSARVPWEGFRPIALSPSILFIITQ